MKKVRFITMVRKTPPVEHLMVAFWFCILMGALAGFFGEPSTRIGSAVGWANARFVVSGIIGLVALLGLHAHFCKQRGREARAFFATAVMGLCYALLFIFGSTDPAGSLQTGSYLMARAPIAAAMGLMVKKHYVIPVTKKEQ